MSNYLYVDNSNVWIEGMHVSAVRRGLARTVREAQERKITDSNWKLDFGKLYGFAGGSKSEVASARLYGSRPPKNDSLWSIAKSKGFEVIVHDRSVKNKEKRIDTNIATDITADSYERMDVRKDEITLVAGDGDYVPTLERVMKRGLRFHVVFWSHASSDLKKVATTFTNLNSYLDHLAL